MKLSARNVFRGTVTAMQVGPIMASVQVDIGGGHVISALISAAAVKDLGLAEGSPVSTIVKATEVMVATDE
jgi:molybdate transport system regulatory protein